MEAAEVVLDEPGFEEEVLRRVSYNGKLGENDELGTLFFGEIDELDCLAAIAGDVTDGGVGLGEGDTHDG